MQSGSRTKDARHQVMTSFLPFPVQCTSRTGHRHNHHGQKGADLYEFATGPSLPSWTSSTNHHGPRLRDRSAAQRGRTINPTIHRPRRPLAIFCSSVARGKSPPGVPGAGAAARSARPQAFALHAGETKREQRRRGRTRREPRLPAIGAASRHDGFGSPPEGSQQIPPPGLERGGPLTLFHS